MKRNKYIKLIKNKRKVTIRFKQVAVHVIF